jgi:hypothetical protein
MRSALVALAAATTFFIGVFELGGSGKSVPDPIEAGAAGQRPTKSPAFSEVVTVPRLIVSLPFSLGTIDRFEEVEPLVHIEPIDTFGQPDEGAARVSSGLGASDSLEPDPSDPSNSGPRPNPAPSEPEPSPTPSPSPSPSPSPTPRPSPSPTPTPSPSESPAP